MYQKKTCPEAAVFPSLKPHGAYGGHGGAVTPKFGFETGFFHDEFYEKFNVYRLL